MVGGSQPSRRQVVLAIRWSWLTDEEKEDNYDQSRKGSAAQLLPPGWEG